MTPSQQTRFEAIREEVLQDLPGMKIIQDPQTGELAVWAKDTQHEKLSSVLEQLKATGDPSSDMIT